MGWFAEHHRRRRERIRHMIKAGFSNREMYAQGCAETTVLKLRKELGIPDPGDALKIGEAEEGMRRAGVRGRARHALFGKAAGDVPAYELYVDDE